MALLRLRFRCECRPLPTKVAGDLWGMPMSNGRLRYDDDDDERSSRLKCI